MERLKNFLKTSVLGGLLVILPVAILILVIKWVFELVTGAIQPLSNLLNPNSQIQQLLADFVVIAIIVAACFAVGVLVRTRLGSWAYRFSENRILKYIPGYSVIKETVTQFIGNKKSPFSSVALAQIFGNETMVTVFVTDEHPDGSYTVFMPTGPNPTSGNIYHLKGEYVHSVDVPVEEAMRSIISCGAGSEKLIGSYLENDREAAS